MGVEPTTLGFLQVEDQSAKPLHHAAIDERVTTVANTSPLDAIRKRRGGRVKVGLALDRASPVCVDHASPGRPGLARLPAPRPVVRSPFALARV